MNYPVNENRQSDGMALASMVLGIVGLATFCCVYTPIICGALAVIFALLSRGGSRSMPPRAKAGLIMGISGIVLGIMLITISFVVVIIEFGGFENYMDFYFNLLDGYGYTMDPYGL